MKKSLLQKPIKEILFKRGFEHIKGDSFAINSDDGITKIIIRIPSGKNGCGFLLGAQFADFGTFDGLITNATMRQFDYSYELAYPESHEYTDEQIQEVTSRLLADYDVYIKEGAAAIKARIDNWTFGNLSDYIRDKILRYFGLKGIDQYSLEYQGTVAERMINGGAEFIALSEYLDHKEFYDNYQNFNAKIIVDEKSDQVMICFSDRKWYQQ